MSTDVNDTKETIYVDVEDEITSIIDKVKSSNKKIVALVLPKRAASLQSIVNMKLLDRTAQNSKKNVVLITKEQALLPLAGAAGVYVAPNLQTKPEIPPPPSSMSATTTLPVDSEPQAGPEDDSLEVERTEPEVKPETPAKPKKSKKKPKIPNFEKFRLRLILGILAVLLLIAGWVMGAIVLPKATITLATDTQDINTNFNLTADTQASKLDLESKTIPATRKNFRATDSEKVQSTGEKNIGKKADGEILMELTSCDKGSVTIPEGTTVTSGGLNYVTEDEVTLGSVVIFGICQNETRPDISSDTVDVTAQEPGKQYNIGEDKSFSVAGYSDIDAESSKKFKGGSNKIVKIVTQGDADRALQAIEKRANDDAPGDLKDELQDEGYYPLGSTLQSEDPVITTSPNVGDKASDVTVTATTSYTMDGVKEQQLRQLIDAEADKKIDNKEQNLQDYQLSDATINLRGGGDSGDQLPLNIKITLTAGPELDKQQIKEAAAGKTSEEVKDQFEGRPGVNGVDVEYNPFWVKKVPSNSSKIEIRVNNESDN